MTRAYYTDSYTLEFEAAILAVETHDGRPAVILDRSFFYPTSGGQPHDTGELRQAETVARVVDVIDAEDDRVSHVLDRPLAPGPVAATIDRDRRRDHMEHHTGQHILSAAFVRAAAAETVGFHLSDQTVTIDLDRADLSGDEIDAAETLANEVVRDDRPVNVRFVTAAEAATLPLRKTPPGRDGTLRLIDVADFDLTACGGTHVARSGEVGVIKVIKTERRGATTRVEFVCGGRALADYRAKHELVRQLSASLTTGAAELPAAIDKLRDETRTLGHTLRQKEAALLAMEAAQLLAAAEPHGATRLVARVFSGRTPDELGRLAAALVAAGDGGAEESVVALLGLAGERSHLVFARSAGAPGDMAALIKLALAALGGRGGGRPALAQGGGPAADEAGVAAAIGLARSQL